MIWEIEDGRTVVEGLDEDGRPDPAYAAALGLRPVPLGRRALASSIEFAIYAFLQLPYWILALPTLLKVATGAVTPYGLVNHPDFLWMVVGTAASFALTLAFIVVQIVLHGRKGVTIGKAFTGIRSVNVATLEKPTVGKALLRALVLWLVFLVPLIGPVLFFLSPLFDGEKRGRGWLDKVGGTWFVDIKRGLDPYHEKRMRVARKTVRAEPEAARSELPSLATPSDRMAQAYQPGARTSSGVVGAARPQAPSEQRTGLTSRPAAAPAPSHAVPGMPAGASRLGGYRPGELSGAPRPAVPEVPGSAPSAIGGIVDSVPGREGVRPPQPSSAPPAARPRATPAEPARPASAQPAPVPSAISDETIIEPDLDRDAAEVVAPRGGDATQRVAGIDDRTRTDAGTEIDDSTVRRVDVVEPEDDLEVTRARPGAGPVAATLAFDTGDRFSITGAALVGRNPAPAAGEVVEHLLPLADESRSISKTHLLITASPLAAVDRASTNGSSVVRAGAEHPLAPGVPFALEPGDTVRFGDRSVRIEGTGAAS